VAFDRVSAAARHLRRNGGQAGVLDFGHPAAGAADDVMVMGGLAGDIGVLTGRQVDAFERLELGEQVERAKDRRPTYRQPSSASVGQQVGRREVALALRDQIGDRPPGAGHTVAGTRQRGRETHAPDDTQYQLAAQAAQRGRPLEWRPMVDYDRTTGLLVVDVQNDFADPAGSLYVKGGEEVVPVANAEIERALGAGARVFYTQDWHPASTPHFKKDGGIWPVHCVQGMWGAEFHPELHVEGSVVRKGSNGEDGYSGFTMRDPTTSETIPTALAAMLEEAGVTRLVLAGLTTDYCVKETLLDARRHGYPVTVIEDAIRAVDLAPGDGDRAKEEMLAAGGLLASRRTVESRD
jgi:nicotinamidase/pyrazinamidase